MTRFFRKTLAAIAAILCSMATQAETLDGLDEYIVQAMSEWQIPGLSIAIVHNDAVIYSKGFGVREVGKRAKVDPNTVFALSSNGKAFAAAGVGVMVDQGKLAWDDRVIQYLPYLLLPDAWVTDKVTLRDLLSHRLAGDLGVGKLEIWAFTGLNRWQVLERLRYLAPGSQRFREVFQYGNPNISAAGEAAAAVAGMTWEDYLTATILGPLDMRSATTSVYELWDETDVAPCYMCDLAHTPSFEDAKIDNIVMPHIGTPQGPKPIPWRTVDNIAPAGSINANILDFAKWLQMQLGRGVFNGRRIVSEAVIGEMHSPQMILRAPPYPAGPGFGHLWSYGLGWYVTDYHGRKTVIHTGGITGFRSAMVMLPDENLGVVVLSNEQNPFLNNMLPPALAFVVFDRILGLPDRDRSSEWRQTILQQAENAAVAETALREQRVVGTTPSIEASALDGSYFHPAFGELLVRSGEDKLSMRLATVMLGDLKHWHHDRYRVTWRGPAPLSYFVTYRINESGTVSEIEVEGFGTFNRRG